MSKLLSERLEARLALRATPPDWMEAEVFADSHECRELLSEAAALARRVEGAAWVACSDRLPGPCDHVEVFPNTNETQTYNFYAHYDGGTNGVKAGNWYHNDEAGCDNIIHPTHWRPINREPPPSTEGGEDGSR